MTKGLATRLLLTLATLTPLTASPASAQTLPRVATIAGWRIGSGDSGDGGYAARISRRGRGWSYSHYVEYWRGNGGVVISDEFRSGRCEKADQGIVQMDLGTSRRAFDQRLASYLRDCPLPRAEAAALRRSLARAWPRFLREARRQHAGMDAEIARILRGGG